MKVAKYEFAGPGPADYLISETRQPRDGHSFVQIGYFNGSPKWHVDVLWNVDGPEEVPAIWDNYRVVIPNGNGIHRFAGIDYQKHKL